MRRPFAWGRVLCRDPCRALVTDFCLCPVVVVICVEKSAWQQVVVPCPCQRPYPCRVRLSRQVHHLVLRHASALRLLESSILNPSRDQVHDHVLCLVLRHEPISRLR